MPKLIRHWNYNGHGYGLNVEKLTWEKARDYAKTLGGYLVEIGDKAENEFLKGILSKDLTDLSRDLTFDYQDKNLEYKASSSGPAGDGGNAYYAWTGGTDKDQEGVWVWDYSRLPISKDRDEWGSGAGIKEPDNSGGAQHYLGFALSDWPQGVAPADKIGGYGQWNDIKKDTPLYSIIEYDYPVDEKYGYKKEEPGYNGGGIYKGPNDWARNYLDKTYEAPYAKEDYYYNHKFYDLGEGRYGIQKKGEEKIDEVTKANYIDFKDGRRYIDKDIAKTFDQLTGYDTGDAKCFRLYNAAFTRHPDPEGHAYWTNQYEKGGATMEQIAGSFADSREFKDRYGDNVSNKEYINTCYSNVLGRSPDAEGSNFWEDAMDRGASKGQVLNYFAQSDENKKIYSHLTGYTV